MDPTLRTSAFDAVDTLKRRLLLSDFDQVALQDHGGDDISYVTFELRGARHFLFLVKADDVDHRVRTHLQSALLQGDESPQQRPVASDLVGMLMALVLGAATWLPNLVSMAADPGPPKTNLTAPVGFASASALARRAASRGRMSFTLRGWAGYAVNAIQAHTVAETVTRLIISSHPFYALR